MSCTAIFSKGQSSWHAIPHIKNKSQQSTENSHKQTLHSQYNAVKHPGLAMKATGDFSNCTEQKASMSHRWLDELQGIHMLIKSERWHKLIQNNRSKPNLGVNLNQGYSKILVNNFVSIKFLSTHKSRETHISCYFIKLLTVLLQSIQQKNS